MNYFNDCKTIDEAKKLYKELAKKHHPDREGGDNAIMQKINLEFEKVSKDFFKNTADNSNIDLTEFNEIIEKIIYMENIKIEIIGRWIYVFNCFHQKKELKNLGFWFSSKHKAWIYNKEEKNMFRRTKLTTNEVKNRWGFVEIESKRTTKLV